MIGWMEGAMTDWSHLLIGREAELKALKDAYAEASCGRTRVVAIIAESGFGKTRLVQEFYNWPSTYHDGAGPEGYWPDRLLKREDNLTVNPDIGEAGINDTPMPFLWWGLRPA